MSSGAVVLVVEHVDDTILHACGTAGFATIHANHAPIAISLAERHAPAAIITPRAASGVDGLVFIAELRLAAPDALIVVIGDDSDLSVLDAGADLVLSRPVGEDAIARALACAKRAEPDPQRLRLVIVEPDAHLARVMMRWLRDAFDVVLVATGWRAIEAIRERRPDVVLAELRMPDMDAAELHAGIARVDAGLADHTLFMTTGFIADKTQQFLAQIPGQTIYKPFDLARLRAALSALFT